MLGTTIKNKFRIDALFQETERSVLFKGTRLGDPDPDMPAGQEVVIKVLKDRYMRDRKFLEGYAKELQTTTRLPGNEHVVRYLDADIIGKRFYIVTVRFDGVCLAGKYLEQEHLPYRSLLEATLGMAKVLSFAQSAGLKDRHIRAEDVLVDPATGKIKILRFSTPRASRYRTQTTTRPGEGTQADLLLLGTALYRMVCLDFPKDRWDLPLSDARQQFVDNLRSLAGEEGRPEDLDKVVDLFGRLTTRDLAERPVSLEPVIAELGGLLQTHRKVSDHRARRQEWAERQGKSRALDTAFDTVAALRGVLRRPVDPEPMLDTSPPAAPAAPPAAAGVPAAFAVSAESQDLQEHRALLWDRVDAGGGLLARWDGPQAMAMITGMGFLTFGLLVYSFLFL